MKPPDTQGSSGKVQFYLRLSWIILSGVLALIIVGAKNELVDYQREVSLLRQGIETAQVEQAQVIALAVQDSVLAGDWQLAQAELDRFGTLSPGNSLLLLDTKGTIQAASQDKPPSGLDPETLSLPPDGQPDLAWLKTDQTLRVVIPVIGNNAQPAAVLVSDTDQAAQFSALNQAKTSQMVHFLLIILLVLFIFFLICWLLFIRPLNLIYDLSRAITQGIRRVQLPESPVIELQRINIAFNEMVEHLVDQRESLEALNSTLEDTVAERTHALEESNAAIRSHNALMHALITESERLNRTVTLDEVIATIGEGMMALSNTSRLAIFVNGPHGSPLCAWSRNLSAAFINIALEIAGRSLSVQPCDPKPFLVSNIDQEGAGSQVQKLSAVEPIRALAAWPLVFEQRASAMVFCFYDQPVEWKQNELEILETFIRQASASYENARLYEAECAQRVLAEALREISATLNRSLDLDEVLEGILNNLGRVVTHDAAGIMLIEGEEIHPVRWHGIPESSAAAFKTWRYAVSELKNRQVMIETSQAIVIPDTHENPDWILTRGLEWVRSYAGAPICQRGEVTGFIDVMSGQAGFFFEDVAPILQTFANQAAIALENARLYQNTQQRMAETSALYRAIQPLFHPVEDILALAQQITESVTQEFASAHCSILFVDEDRTHLMMAAQSGSLQLDSAPLALDGPGLTVLAARTGQAVYSPDVTREANYISGGDETRSELAIPLHGGGQVIGILNMESPLVDAFDDRARRLLASFAERAALSLENARLFATIRQNAQQMSRLSEIAQRRAQEADTLRLATAAVSSTLELQTVLDSILKHLEQVIPHDSACIFLLEDERHVRVWAVKSITQMDEVLYQRFPRDDALLHEIENTMRPMVLSDAQSDPRFHSWGGTDHVHGWMGVPLVAGKEFVGILTLDRRERNAFRPEEMDLAQAFANQAAVAVQNARLYQDAQQRARELEALHTATTSLVSTLDLQKLLQRILSAASSAIPATQAAALHLLDENNQLNLRVEQGIDSSTPGGPDWNHGSSPWAWVIRQREPLMIGAGRPLPDGIAIDTLPGEWKSSAIIIAPLILESRPLGAISLISQSPRGFTQEEMHLLISFASTATAAIHNAQLHSAVQHMAITDPLTGAYNLRGFFDLAQKIIRQALRAERPISAIMIDIDYFKRVNDTYGHDAGDTVLRELTDRCRSALRESDLICRSGGEEFAILLPESDMSGARAAADRLYSSITENPIYTASGPVSITISVGIAETDAECDTLDKLLKRADQALYLAKGQGRNRVCEWVPVG